MNFFKLIKALKLIIDEQKEMLDIGEVQLMNGFSGRGWRKDVVETRRFLNMLSPVTKELETPLNKRIFDDASATSYLPLCNNRVCIFQGENGKIYSAFYSDKAASCEDITNDHYKLYSYLERVAYKDYGDLRTTKRWCGFYDFVCNNRETILIFHGMSDTFPHNENSLEILKEAVKQNFGGLDEWSTPDKIILIGETIEILKP